MKEIVFCLMLLFSSDLIQSQDKIAIRTDEYVNNQTTFQQTGATQWICPDFVNITASSELLTESAFNYSAKNLKDVKFNTVWIEGETGLGEGTKITFDFELNHEQKFDSQFFFVNGYAYNEKIWQEHSRVKTFAIYINDAFIQNLEVEDTQNLQWIQFNLHLSPQDQITFEITECYQGTAYQDTAVAMLVPLCSF